MANNTAELKKFAQAARRQLREQVASRLEQVLGTDSAELRQQADAIRELRQQIVESSKKAVIDRVAYTWFNRFCALRFMDVNRYNRIGVVSPAEGYTLPEILQEAKQGYIDDDLANLVNRPMVFDLLSGKAPSRDPQQEAYRLLVVGMCNSLSKTMPFLFEPINDYTELLMPPDLLSENSILHELRKVMTAEACQDVEIIGWLYQYYISERKDEVFEALKQNQKIEAEDIPAATQLFTPHWIVRYLVENSLGRLWMLNQPNSKLAEKMEYYIRPAQEETDFLRIHSPEEIKICDPACGSGHMLTYAFDVLHTIYEEEGYPAVEIPRLILEKNLYGIEIDERAGTLAAFALVMKASAHDRRFFSREVQPNICVLENIRFNDQELKEYVNRMGRDLFTEPLLQALKQFEQSKNFGSLIRPALSDATYVRGLINSKRITDDLLLYDVHERVMKVLKQVEYLASRYNLVVTNPPYKGRGELNIDLQNFMEINYPKSKGDLFACFIERGLDFLISYGLNSMVTMQGWLFIDTYKELRVDVLEKHSILNLIQIGFNSFPELNSKFALAAAFSIEKGSKGKVGNFITLNNSPKNADKEVIFFEQKNGSKIFRIHTDSFKYIEGTPISFEASENLRKIFYTAQQLGAIAEPRQGMATGDNERFVRVWSEVNFNKIGIGYHNRKAAQGSQKKWFPYNKGGGFRKWYGNQIFVVNWENDGAELFNFRPNAVIRNPDYYFRECITWSLVGLTFGPRYTPNGFLFDVGGSSAFPAKEDMNFLLAFMASKISSKCLVTLNPTLNYQVGDIQRLPIKFPTNDQIKKEIDELSTENIYIAKEDWNRQEKSWDFSKNALLNFSSDELTSSYKAYCDHWRRLFTKLLANETRLNQLFIEIYKLQGEMESEADLTQITILDEVASVNKGFLEFNIDLIITELISYTVGCMFGRYSLDKPGLILANQGETLQDYLKQVPEPTFFPDEDNVIPIMDGEWFSDDITERFKKFLRVTFGDEHYEENLAFIEEAIGRDIRSYFVRDFYAYHVKMYQKRPIYWLFSSPKGSFNVLIYMHRYNRDTLSVILNKYLRPFQSKLEARKSYLEQLSISGSASPREKTAALKEIEKLTGTLEELRVYERDILYPLAAQRIEIDLDDGVKVNYAKFGKALAKIPGLTS